MKEVEFMWALAQIHPATVQEIATFLDEEPRSGTTVATKLWREGLLMRKRVEDNSVGESPYMYTIRPADM